MVNGKGYLLMVPKIPYCRQEWQSQQRPWPASVRTPDLWMETLGPQSGSFSGTEGAPLLAEEFKLTCWHMRGEG